MVQRLRQHGSLSMEINDGYDMPKEVAEKVLKSIMEPLKTKKEAGDEEATTLYDRLGILAMGLAHAYSNEEKYQTTLNTMARENVRYADTVMVLSEQLATANKMLEEAVTALAEIKLKEEEV